jgi:hypothetical protein
MDTGVGMKAGPHEVEIQEIHAARITEDHPADLALGPKNPKLVCRFQDRTSSPVPRRLDRTP